MYKFIYKFYYKLYIIFIYTYVCVVYIYIYITFERYKNKPHVPNKYKMVIQKVGVTYHEFMSDLP